MTSPTKDCGRVIVAITDSLTGLRAIREAVSQARHRRAQLIAVRAFAEPKPLITPVRDMTELYGFSAQHRDHELDQQWHRRERRAAAEIRQAFSDALGGVPRDIPVELSVAPGRLISIVRETACRDDDLIVLALEKTRFRKMIRADCPVLLVPPHEFARTIRRSHRLTVQDLMPQAEKTG
jgi:nucleotide-binding universal stress UspA family protein